MILKSAINTKILLTLILITASTFVFSQKLIGVRAGVNLFTQIAENEIYDMSDSKNKYGISGNLAYQFPIFSFMAWRNEIGYNQKGARYVGSLYSYTRNLDYMDLQSNFVFRTKMFPVYVFGGGYASYCLSASAVEDNASAYPLAIDNQNMLFYDAGAVGGFGFIRTLGTTHSYIEARYNYGLLDVNNMKNANGLDIINYNRGFGVYIGVFYYIR